MDDRLIYASQGKLRGYQLGALAVAVAIPAATLAGIVELDRLQRGLGAVLVLIAALTVVALERRIRRPVPEIRLSTEGIEGAFGMVKWDDVTGVELKTRLRLRARGVVIRLRPGAGLWTPSREYAEVGDELQQLYGDRLELESRHLELAPHELLREIELFRMYAFPNVD